MTDVFTRKGNSDTEKDTRDVSVQKEDHVKTEAICKSKKGAAEETKPNNTLTLEYQPPELWEKFLLFKPPSPWWFITAALENQYGTEASVYKGEGKEFISLLNRTFSDAYQVPGVSLDAGESIVDKMGRQAGRQAGRKWVQPFHI